METKKDRLSKVIRLGQRLRKRLEELDIPVEELNEKIGFLLDYYENKEKTKINTNQQKGA